MTHQQWLYTHAFQTQRQYCFPILDARWFNWANRPLFIGERSERGQATASAGMEGGEVLGTLTVPEDQHPLSVRGVLQESRSR